MTFDDVKKAVKEQTDEWPLQTYINEEGSEIIMTNPLTGAYLYDSEASLNTEQEAAAIETCHRMAAELGILLQEE